MRSRGARLILGVFSLIVLSAAAAFVYHSQQQVLDRRAALRAFDEHAREAARLLSDLRASQHAYVAAGQGLDFWIPKVNAASAEAAQLVDRLRATAASSAARASLMETAATITEFANVDRRAREYLASDQLLMAADVVFTEGAATAAEAAQQVESARLAERQEFDAWEGTRQQMQAAVSSAGGGFAALVITLLAFAVGPTRPRETAALEARTGEEPPRASVPALKIAAELCTELSRVQDSAALTATLGRAADVMDASGLVVWMANPAAADLRPVVAHGYTPQMLARMPAVSRTADNAAAAAYRSCALQIVLARPGQSNGALVAPLLTPDGCIGALTVEIRGGGETADATQALAAIFAAQLASVLASSVAAATDDRIATG